MLIDWLTFDLPYLGARVFSQEFEKPWDSDIVRPKKISGHGVEGSYSARIHVLCAGGRMTVSGNPVKFFTGQNVIGISDLQELVLLTYEAVIVACGIPECPTAKEAILNGDVNLTRVDVTDHYDVGTDDDVRFFLEALGQRADLKHRGRGTFHSLFCSVGWGFGGDRSNGESGNGSRRSTLKFYNKLQEIKRHPMTTHQNARHLLTEWVTGKVRVEACYRGTELKRLGFKLSKDWDAQTPRVLLDRFLEKLDMPDQVQLSDDVTAQMPNALRGTYHLWRTGADLRSMVSRPTYYRHRRMLLEFGVDINLRPDVAASSSGRTVYLVRILKGEPCSFPHENLFADLALEGFERLKESVSARREVQRGIQDIRAVA